MQKPTSDDYRHVFAMPDPAITAQSLRATITLVQAAKDALKDDPPGNLQRAEAALIMVLAGLKALAEDYDTTAAWLASAAAEGAERPM